MRLMDIQITATFTANHVVPALRLAMTTAALPIGHLTVSYGNILGDIRMLSGGPDSVTIILIRLEDLAPAGSDIGLSQNVNLVIDGITEQLKTHDAAVIVCVCPPSDFSNHSPLLSSSIRGAERVLRDYCDNASSCTFLDLSKELDEYDDIAWNDAYSDKVAHIPYTDAFFNVLGVLIARSIYQMYCVPTKMIVVDADNTLWSGVCGEVSPTELVLHPRNLAIQECLVRQAQIGRLICICSHNNIADVKQVFLDRDDMPLRLEHITDFQVEWREKTDLIEILFERYQVTAGTVIFFDDDPLQCARMRDIHPEVATVHWPDSDLMATRKVRHLWRLDSQRVTLEDRQRLDFQRTQDGRLQHLRLKGSYHDLIELLEIKTDIFNLEDSDFARAAQLVSRTTQFNFTPRVTGRVPLIPSDNGIVCVGVRVADKFGNYGHVGLMSARHLDGGLHIDTFLLSCRALRRGIEYKMAAWLGKHAVKHQLQNCIFQFYPTSRNIPAQVFLDDIEKRFNGSRGTGSPSYAVTVPSQSLKLAYPDWSVDHVRTITANADLQKDSNTKASSSHSQQPDWEMITTKLSDPKELQVLLGKRPSAPSTKKLVLTPVEVAIVEIWEDILGVDSIGTGSDFFELGGHSLLAARIVSRVKESLDVEIGIEAVFDFPTVESLAKAVSVELSKTSVNKDTHKTNAIDEFYGVSSLSSSQERFIFAEEYSGISGFSNVVLVVSISGYLNSVSLASALLGLVDRHEALRTLLVTTDQSLGQFVTSVIPPALQQLDFSPFDELTKVDKLTEVVTTAAITQFDLTIEQLLRAQLVRLDTNSHKLVLTLHHSSIDAISQNILMDELGKLYNASLGCNEVVLPDLTSSFKEFAELEKAAERRQSLANDTHYWQKRLSAASPPFPLLPMSRTPGRLKRHSFEIPQSQVNAVNLKAIEYRTTTFTINITAFALAIGVATANSDVVIGVPTSLRTTTKFDPIVGCFINTIPICLNGAAEMHDIKGLIETTGRTILDGISHSGLPLEDILRCLPNRQLKDLIQVSFQLRSDPLQAPDMVGLETELTAVPQPYARLPLGLTLEPNGERFTASLDYDSSLFDDTFVLELYYRYTSLLDALTRPL